MKTLKSILAALILTVGTMTVASAQTRFHVSVNTPGVHVSAGNYQTYHRAYYAQPVVYRSYDRPVYRPVVYDRYYSRPVVYRGYSRHYYRPVYHRGYRRW